MGRDEREEPTGIGLRVGTENHILRNQIDGCVQLTDSERQELAELGAKLDKKALAAIATVAKAETILAWRRKCADQKVDTSS